MWKTRDASRMVKGSSATSSGCTNAIREIDIDTACSTKPLIMERIPNTQTGRRTRSRSIRSENARDSGTSWFARRCNTDAVAFSAAATIISAMPSTSPPTRPGSGHGRGGQPGEQAGRHTVHARRGGQPAWDEHLGAAPSHTRDEGAGDPVRRDRSRETPVVAATGEERGGNGARQDGGDPDSVVPPDFSAQRVGEPTQARLRRGVHGLVRDPERRDRRHEHHVPTPLPQPGQQPARDLHRRRQVHRDEVVDRPGRGVRQRTGHADTRRVDQQRHPAGSGAHGIDAGARAQVRPHGTAAGAGRHRLQPRAVAPDQHQLPALPAQVVGDGRADAR